jgi:hypothetical protein
MQTMSMTLRVLGPVGGSCLICPGNQAGYSEDRRCAYAAKCPALAAGKAPAGQLCPLEVDVIEERFNSWCLEIGTEPMTIKESERIVISELTWLDIQEQRCASILSRGEAARLTQINVKEVHPETGEQLAWERVLHANATLLDQIHTKRRMLFKDWELTPEMKTKKAKIEGKGKGDDLGSQLTAKANKLRRMGPVIDVK